MTVFELSKTVIAVIFPSNFNKEQAVKKTNDEKLSSSVQRVLVELSHASRSTLGRLSITIDTFGVT